MKLQQIVILWHKERKDLLRVFPIGEVDLRYYGEAYTADCAVHEDFRLMKDGEAVDYLVLVIKHLLTSGFKMDFLHFHLLGVIGYDAAFKKLNNEMQNSN